MGMTVNSRLRNKRNDRRREEIALNRFAADILLGAAMRDYPIAFQDLRTSENGTDLRIKSGEDLIDVHLKTFIKGEDEEQVTLNLYKKIIYPKYDHAGHFSGFNQENGNESAILIAMLDGDNREDGAIEVTYYYTDIFLLFLRALGFKPMNDSFRIRDAQGILQKVQTGLWGAVAIRQNQFVQAKDLLSLLGLLQCGEPALSKWKATILDAFAPSQPGVRTITPDADYAELTEGERAGVDEAAALLDQLVLGGFGR